MSGRVIRVELVIATLALVASACASIAAILQTHESAVETQATLEQTQLVSKQLGSSLWPYLALNKTISPTSVTLGFTNDGLGPALIRSFTVSRDGRPVAHLREVIDAIDPRPAKRRAARRIGEEDFGVGSVLRPSENLTIVSISDPNLSRSRLQQTLAGARFEVCYCSLLGDCWSLQSSETEPHAVRSCPLQKAPVSL